MEISVRPGTLADFEAWYERKPEHTTRFWVATIDGDVVAVAGFALYPDVVYAFSGVKPQVAVPVRTVLYWAGKLFEEMKKHRLPLLAKADPGMKNSGRFLEKMGFRLLEPAADGDVYTWNSYH